MLKYRERIEKIHQRYGERIWALLYQADVRCRLEAFECIRRQIATEQEMLRKEQVEHQVKTGKDGSNAAVSDALGFTMSSIRIRSKAVGAEPAGQRRDEIVHAVVARSTFRSQNVQSTPAPDHFCQLRCRKSARRCGAKHISKSKCTKHTRFGPLLEVEMSKKCTPLWREAHFQVKMYKTPHVRATFGS